MNEFILLLWVANVVENISVLVFVFGLLGGALLAFGHIADELPDGFYERHSKKLSTFAAFFVFLILLPSPSTIHAYAALNATKDIAETQIGKKALAALEAKFDEIIEENHDE